MSVNLKMYAILGGTIVLLGLALGFMWDKLQQVKTERNQAIEFNNAREDSLVYYRNGMGQEIARNAVLDLTLRNIQRLRSDERVSWISKFDGVNKRLNNLESATRTVAQAIGIFTIPVASVPEDTLDWATWLNDSTWAGPQHIRTFDNHNEWIRVRGTITDSVVVRVDAYVPIENVVFWQRKKVVGLRIGRKHWFSETSSSNPYVKITESTVIRVGKRKRK